MADAAAPKAWIGHRRLQPPGPALAENLIGCNQRGGRGERHLEARADHLMRRPEQDENGCDDEIAHCERRAIKQDRRKHDAQHDKTAQRRHPAARQEQVDKRGEKGEQRRDFLRRKPGRKHRECRQQQPYNSHHGTRHKRHVKPGYGRDMRKAAHAHCFIRFSIDAARQAGDQRCGHFAALSLDLAAHAFGNFRALLLEPELCFEEYSCRRYLGPLGF